MWLFYSYCWVWLFGYSTFVILGLIVKLKFIQSFFQRKSDQIASLDRILPEDVYWKRDIHTYIQTYRHTDRDEKKSWNYKNVGYYNCKSFFRVCVCVSVRHASITHLPVDFMRLRWILIGSLRLFFARILNC